ncbi:hypothetical protein N7471_013550 [Penicillium samsonianum]|uniref:uncharacterized protein n=1 Tax=Penicillium samsonianum TaxID=1882272 RepID=UPI002548EDE9|nr:uncharacterized protein N7471_013550 [Penicillium samsonianum]KAJ6118930.1 hypothetical protein N7471_013550 [Penicillium samsonianum]
MADDMEQIAVDPDFYSMATGYGMDPQDFQSETTSIASTIARGRYQATKENDYWGPSDEQQFEAFEIGDVADLYPSAIVRGVDIFPPPVTWMPPNCVFEVDDVLREWTWTESFDFIHMRLMYGAFPPEGWDQRGPFTTIMTNNHVVEIVRGQNISLISLSVKLTAIQRLRIGISGS